MVGGYDLTSLNAGNSSIGQIELRTKLYGATYFVPTVQWDGKEMTVSSTLTQVKSEELTGPVNIYQLSISGSQAKVTGKTRLDAPQNKQRGETWIQGSAIIGVDYDHGWPNVEFWPYPKGGNPTRHIRHKQYPPASLLDGVTLSVTPK